MVEVIAVLSILVFALGAAWFGRPFLRGLGRAEALTVLVGIHVFRYSALFALLGQHDSSKTGGVIGDLIGAALALLTVFALHRRWSIAPILTWLLVVETIVDFVLVFARQGTSPSLGDPTGVLVLVVGFEVPLLIVTLPLLVWQLVSRRREPLAVAQQASSGKGSA